MNRHLQTNAQQPTVIFPSREKFELFEIVRSSTGIYKVLVKKSGIVWSYHTDKKDALLAMALADEIK